jgi:hypothetical protein
MASFAEFVERSYLMRRRSFIVLFLALILAGCKPLVSASDWQTAVAEVKLTAVASITPLPQLQSEDLVNQEEAQALQADLNAAEKTLTAQAEEIANLQGQLEAQQDQVEVLRLSLTPDFTATLRYTATPVGTPTPVPTATSAIPEDQKVVIASGGPAPLFEVDFTNDAGYPVMVKTDPVLRFDEGEWFLIYKGEVRADGEMYFYKVAGPVWSGYYVRVNDVKDQ